MKRPEINGWEVTTNENGIKMATLPRETIEKALKYIEYAEKQLRIGGVSKSFCDYCETEITQNDSIWICGDCREGMR